MSEEAAGRIVVHVYDNGTFGKDNKEPLPDMAAVTEYVTQRKEKIDAGAPLGAPTPTVHSEDRDKFGAAAPGAIR